MKKLLATGLASALVAATAFGQGTVNFKNYFGHPTTDPAVFFDGGINKAFGSQYEIALLGGASAGSLSLIATTTFLTQASAAGFYVGPSVAIPGVAGGGTAFIQIEVWDTTLNGTTTGASFAAAEAYAQSARVANMWGTSTIFSVVTGDPTATPPGLPTNLVPGLTAMSLNPVPEPTTFALAGLAGAAGLIFRRRK